MHKADTVGNQICSGNIQTKTRHQKPKPEEVPNNRVIDGGSDSSSQVSVIVILYTHMIYSTYNIWFVGRLVTALWYWWYLDYRVKLYRST